MNQNAQRLSEGGNALFIILIAVALLGALSYAVTQSNRGGVSALTEEKAEVYAAEILQYAQTVANAVAQLRLRGCDETEISFENNVGLANYINPNSPSDKTCHVFHPSGGGLSWSVPDQGMIAGTVNADNWAVYMQNEFSGIGTTGANDQHVDLALFLNDVKPSICLHINSKLNIINTSNTPPSDGSVSDDEFTGTFQYDDTIGDEDINLNAKKSACFYDISEDWHSFYKVLIAR